VSGNDIVVAWTDTSEPSHVRTAVVTFWSNWAADGADNADGRGFEARGHLRYPLHPRLRNV